MQFSGTERRKHKRLKKPFMVKFAISQESEAKQWNTIAVLDIGAGGTLFYYNHSLDINSSLNVRVTCSLEDKVILCKATVVRLDEIIPNDLSLVAMVFSGMSAEDSLALEKIVKEYHK